MVSKVGDSYINLFSEIFPKILTKIEQNRNEMYIFNFIIVKLKKILKLNF